MYARAAVGLGPRARRTGRRRFRFAGTARQFAVRHRSSLFGYRESRHADRPAAAGALALGTRRSSVLRAPRRRGRSALSALRSPLACRTGVASRVSHSVPHAMRAGVADRAVVARRPPAPAGRGPGRRAAQTGRVSLRAPLVSQRVWSVHLALVAGSRHAGVESTRDESRLTTHESYGCNPVSERYTAAAAAHRTRA